MPPPIVLITRVVEGREALSSADIRLVHPSPSIRILCMRQAAVHPQGTRRKAKTPERSVSQVDARNGSEMRIRATKVT